jgi:signal transduction histidine kinase/ActR/RegA family two-component response regulator
MCLLGPLRWCGWLALAGAVAAQEAAIEPLVRRRAVAAVDSPEWWYLGCELIEAQLDVDVAVAVATGQELMTTAMASAQPWATNVVGAVLGNATARLEGPGVARQFEARLEEPSATVPANLRSHWYLARARWVALQRQHDQRVSLAWRGRNAAVEADDLALQVRASLLLLHELPRHGLAELRELFAIAERGGRATELQHLEPWLRFEEHLWLKEQDRHDDANRILTELEPLAAARGDRRLAADVLLRWARYHWHQEQFAQSAEAYERAAAAFAALHDRPGEGYVLEVWADAEHKRGDLAAAERLVVENRQLCEGRDLPAHDLGILYTRLQLALAAKDGPLAAQWSEQIEASCRQQEAGEHQLERVREQLAAIDSDKLAADTAIREARDRADSSRRHVRLVIAASLAVVLAGAVAMALHSRRRLLALNGRLAQQVAYTAAAQAEQSRLEARMRDLERTESLGTLAAGIAHDFNNLLTSILGNADLLTPSTPSEEVSLLARNITTAGQQAARMCRQLQIYAGGMPIALVPLELGEVLRSALPVLRAAVQDRLLLNLSIEGGATGVEGDRSQLEQVMLNLVVNARDAGARAVEIRMKPAPGAVPLVRILVEDNGEGMAPEVAQRVFDPFFTTRFPGRGLGLAVVHGLVRRHGGSVEVHSQIGRGTTFTIVLPAADAPPAAMPNGSTGTGSAIASDLTALVVDDEMHVRDLMVRMLRVAGLERVEAVGPDALATRLDAGLGGGEIVAFVDLEMPGLDGPAAVALLRTRRPGIRIVLMSGHASDHVERIAATFRPDALLAKPFLSAQLRAALRQALATRNDTSDP